MNPKQIVGKKPTLNLMIIIIILINLFKKQILIMKDYLQESGINIKIISLQIFKLKIRLIVILRKK